MDDNWNESRGINRWVPSSAPLLGFLSLSRFDLLKEPYWTKKNRLQYLRALCILETSFACRNKNSIESIQSAKVCDT